MDKDLYKLKKILYNLESGYSNGKEIELLDNLIIAADEMKSKYIKIEETLYSDDNIKLDKISEETFLYKPVMTKNYYEGDYLERFGEIRTSDLKNCKLLEMHNQFWKAYVVQRGNIFASIPKALASKEQIDKLSFSGWDSVKVDVYEITKCNLTKRNLKTYIKRKFKHHILVIEMYSGSTIILNYNLK